MPDEFDDEEISAVRDLRADLRQTNERQAADTAQLNTRMSAIEHTARETSTKLGELQVSNAKQTKMLEIIMTGIEAEQKKRDHVEMVLVTTEGAKSVELAKQGTEKLSFRNKVIIAIVGALGTLAGIIANSVAG
jgi:hypothetical protein